MRKSLVLIAILVSAAAHIGVLFAAFRASLKPAVSEVDPPGTRKVEVMSFHEQVDSTGEASWRGFGRETARVKTTD